MAWIERPVISSDDRRAAAAERLVNRLPGAAVVLNWALHALDRLLRAVAGF